MLTETIPVDHHVFPFFFFLPLFFCHTPFLMTNVVYSSSSPLSSPSSSSSQLAVQFISYLIPLLLFFFFIPVMPYLIFTSLVYLKFCILYYGAFLYSLICLPKFFSKTLFPILCPQKSLRMYTIFQMQNTE